MKRTCVPFSLLLLLAQMPVRAQSESAEQRLQQLNAAVTQLQTQINAYQSQMQQVQQQLSELQLQLNTAAPHESTATPGVTDLVAPASDDIRERQAMLESQIATHEQSKVETESKYALRLNGLILMNAFVNTRHVDEAIDPTYALNGAGTTGLSVRQSILGLDATGPHLMGAATHADLHVDFFANGSQPTYGASGIMRLRTAHASLQWRNTEAYFALDRALIAPNVPTSLVSTAQPNLAWNGDLWTWNPQIGIRHEIAFSSSKRLLLQGALIDVQDPLLPNATSTSTLTRAERSRWPGFESRIAFASGERGIGTEFGVGGYFSPHRTSEGYRFNAWALTVDMRLPIGRHFELTSNAYRGAGLGGLGGGGYVDYTVPINTQNIASALNDAGGWVQAKVKQSERLQFNTGFGIDNPFGSDIRMASIAPGSSYLGLTKTRAAYGNFVVSPSRYLLFSIEYRHLWSNYWNSPMRSSDVIGLAAGYRF